MLLNFEEGGEGPISVSFILCVSLLGHVKLRTSSFFGSDRLHFLGLGCLRVLGQVFFIFWVRSF